MHFLLLEYVPRIHNGWSLEVLCVINDLCFSCFPLEKLIVLCLISENFFIILSLSVAFVILGFQIMYPVSFSVYFVTFC